MESHMVPPYTVIITECITTTASTMDLIMASTMTHSSTAEASSMLASTIAITEVLEAIMVVLGVIMEATGITDAIDICLLYLTHMIFFTLV